MTNATVRASVLSAPAEAPALWRELGKWDLTAIGINQVIGSGVFILPSLVAAQLGTWSPLALLATGFASLLVALCFAELSSRFEGTGGPTSTPALRLANSWRSRWGGCSGLHE